LQSEHGIYSLEEIATSRLELGNLVDSGNFFAVKYGKMSSEKSAVAVAVIHPNQGK
jgi:hypothetical protein